MPSKGYFLTYEVMNPGENQNHYEPSALRGAVGFIQDKLKHAATSAKGVAGAAALAVTVALTGSSALGASTNSTDGGAEVAKNWAPDFVGAQTELEKISKKMTGPLAATITATYINPAQALLEKGDADGARDVLTKMYNATTVLASARLTQSDVVAVGNLITPPKVHPTPSTPPVVGVAPTLRPTPTPTAPTSNTTPTAPTDSASQVNSEATLPDAQVNKKKEVDVKPKPAVGSKEEKEAKKMEGLKIALAEAASKLGSDASKWQPGTQGKGSTKSRNDKGGVLLKFDKGKLSEDESLTAEGFACLKGAKLAPGNYKVTFSGAPNGPICMWMFNGAGNILEDGTPANTAGRIMKQGPEFNITVPSGCIGVDFGYITSALNPEVRFDSMKVTPLDIQYPELAKK